MRKAKAWFGRFFTADMAVLKRPGVKKALIITGASLVGVLLLVQLVYPRDRTLLGTYLGEHDISGWTKPDVEKLAKELYETSTVEVEGSGKTMLARSLSAVGVTIDAKEVANETVDYPLWLRFVPTSVFWHGHAHEQFSGAVNQNTLNKFVADSESSFVIKPENAKLTTDGAKVKIVDQVRGATLSADEFKKGVKDITYRLGGPTVLDVTFRYSDPVIKKGDLAALQQRAQAIVDTPLKLSFDSTSEAVSHETLASWLVFGQDDAKKADDVTIEINNDVALQFVHTAFDKVVAKPAGVTEVYLTDGVEQSRKAGAEGRAVDEAATQTALHDALLGDGTTEVSVPARSVPAQVKQHHTFTKSLRGLQAYLNSLADEGDIRVSVTQLGGNGWSASYRGGVQTTAASTYKVYVVAYALNQIAEGKLSYDDQINGTSFRECISRTIVNSDNACPEAMIAKFGRSTLNDFLYERGYSRATTFTSAGAAQSSTNDLIKAMIDIQQSTLVKGGERDFMLGLMRAQVYRQGVPAGTSAVVADKVGFLNGYLNDAAIVYHPNGTYVISVMTSGASWGKIAEITRKIEGIMY